MLNYKEFLQFAKDKNASDVHLSTNERPMIRLYGKIYKIDYPKLKKSEVLEIIKRILNSKKKLNQLHEHHDIDFLYSDEKLGRYRVNIYNTHNGFAINLRVINERIFTFDELKLPESVKNILELERGLVLVTGPSSSGKSTTLATLIDMLNKEKKEHILTIEDPVEFIHTPDKAIINHRQVGAHTKSFARALKSALREDPDVILIGELRDLETISLAITAAETGHLVFGTLHTSSAAKTITRIIDAYPPSKHEQIRVMLAESIQMVISQVLLEKKSQDGLVPAFEVMLGTVAIKSLIRENKIHQIPSVLETGMNQGLVSLDKYIENLIRDDKVTLEEGLKYAQHKQELINVFNPEVE